jgi:hypothetical protein
VQLGASTSPLHIPTAPVVGSREGWVTSVTAVVIRTVVVWGVVDVVVFEAHEFNEEWHMARHFSLMAPILHTVAASDFSAAQPGPSQTPLQN